MSMSTSGGALGWSAMNSSKSSPMVTTSSAGMRSRTASMRRFAMPQVTTTRALQSVSWNARSSGGSSGLVGENVAPARRMP